MIGPRGFSYRRCPRRAPRPRTARRAARVGGQRAGHRDLPLEPRGDLGRRALRLAGLRAEPASERRHWDDPTLTRDLGWVTDVWARWDSVWFLRIAAHGYGEAHGVAAAFYPLYPLALAGVGRVFGGHYVAAGIVISLAAALAAFVLLYRLTETRLGADGARRAVLYLAVFPMALFLGAVYSESMFLALAIGAFVLAERGRCSVRASPPAWPC
jgi:hypothetical protein